MKRGIPTFNFVAVDVGPLRSVRANSGESQNRLTSIAATSELDAPIAFCSAETRLRFHYTSEGPGSFAYFTVQRKRRHAAALHDFRLRTTDLGPTRSC